MCSPNVYHHRFYTVALHRTVNYPRKLPSCTRRTRHSSKKTLGKRPCHRANCSSPEGSWRLETSYQQAFPSYRSSHWKHCRFWITHTGPGDTMKDPKSFTTGWNPQHRNPGGHRATNSQGLDKALTQRLDAATLQQLLGQPTLFPEDPSNSNTHQTFGPFKYD